MSHKAIYTSSGRVIKRSTTVQRGPLGRGTVRAESSLAGGEPRCQPEVERPLVSGLVDKNHELSVDEVDQPPSEQVQAMSEDRNEEVANTEAPKDAKYFLQLLEAEQTRLLALADKVDIYAKTLASIRNSSEETMGLLRIFGGSVRLLVSSKMKQFENLCQKSLKPDPEDNIPITVDDLQGFWDMIYLQVPKLDADFEKIEKLRGNNWRRPIEPRAVRASGKATTAAAGCSKNAAASPPKKQMPRKIPTGKTGPGQARK